MSRGIQFSRNPLDDRYLVVYPEGGGSFDAWTFSIYENTELVTSHVSNGFLSCFDWHPLNESIVAASYGNNGIKFVSPFSALQMPSLKLQPKHARQCLALKWNPTHSNWMAAAYDKHKSDKGILIWDLSDAVGAVSNNVSSMPHHPAATASSAAATIPNPPTMSTATASVLNSPDVESPHERHTNSLRRKKAENTNVRPLFELAQAESAHSLLWLPNNNRSFAAGLSHRNIRVIDLRGDPSRAQLTVNTRAVFGLSHNPKQEHQILSFYDNLLYIWDLRSGKCHQPLISLAEHKPIIKAEWGGGNGESISVLCRDTTLIKTYQLEQVEEEDMELSYVDRHIIPQFPSTVNSVASFAWNPTRPSQLLSISNNNQISKQNIYEKVCVAWNQHNDLMTSFGRTMYSSEMIESSIEDISKIMYSKATAGSKNAQMMASKSDVNGSGWIWTWVDRVKAYQLSFKTAGAFHIIRESLDSDTIDPAPESILSSRIHEGAGRTLIRKLCGWHGNEATAAKLADKAAAIAVFNHNVTDAIDILSRESTAMEPEVGRERQMVGMAIAGYKENDLNWSTMCMNIIPTLTSPHLKAILLFLHGHCQGEEGKEPDFTGVMELESLPLYERVGFATLHLNKSAFVSWMEKTIELACFNGDVLGILLTGLDSEGTPLTILQSYVDETGDVQTGALLLIHSGSIPAKTIGLGRTSWSLGSTWAGEDAMESRGWRIVEAYLDLLNQWKLWQTRAQTEALMANLAITESGATPSPRLPPQIYLVCTFCGKQVSGKIGRNRGTKVQNTKLNCCPHCRKPLPRCALCRRHMGTPLPDSHIRSSEGGCERSARFSGWFTWCQQCRHGGHSMHMEKWFANNNECPVNGCSCKCPNQDTNNLN